MTLRKFIRNDGAEFEVDDTSVAAEIMRGNEIFKLVGSEREETPAIVIESPALQQSLSARIRELMLVEKNKTYRDFGCSSFRSFLDSDNVPEFSSSKFYKLRNSLKALGGKKFDLLHPHKIPA